MFEYSKKKSNRNRIRIEYVMNFDQTESEQKVNSNRICQNRISNKTEYVRIGANMSEFGIN